MSSRRGRSAHTSGGRPLSLSIAIPNSAIGTDDDPAFAASLGRIDAALRHHFRHWPGHRREEALAYTWAASLGLLRCGKVPLAVGVVAIAVNCCRAVSNGRSVGARKATGWGVMDVHNSKAQRLTSLRVVPFEELAGPGGWQDWIASDGRYGPADEAAFRVALASWIVGLPERKRRVAELLAQGLGTG